MEFSYEYYKSTTFTWPLIGCIAFGLIGILVFINLCINVKCISNIKKIMNILLLFVIVFGLICNLFHFSYGYKIPLDKKDDAIIAEGEISSIKKAFGSPYYKMENINTNGFLINVSGEIYYIMYIGDIEIGDKVELKYLPKSKIVLSINKKQ